MSSGRNNVLALLLLIACASSDERPRVDAEVVVFGATGAGVVCALAAARSGVQRVVLVSTNNHVGGMLTGGLQHTDSANASVIGGITREIFVRIEHQYPGRPTNASFPPGHSPPGWLFESHVAEAVLNEMLQEANVTLARKQVGILSVARDGSKVQAITTVAGLTFSGRVYVDASYEGDLAAMSQASMTWGRESHEQYGETNAGRQLGSKPDGLTINPYWNATAKDLIPIPHVTPVRPAGIGAADNWTQVYDFRLCFTNSPGHSIPIERPASYNASEWELWRRIYAQKPPKTLTQAGLSCLGPIPNSYSDCGMFRNDSCKKCDMFGMNHGTDFTNGAWEYPNGTIATRAVIWKAHVEYTRGLLWFWKTDDAVPKRVREEIAEYGHCGDEYDEDSDPPHWPHQLYVREARRLVGDFVWTEKQPSSQMRLRSIGLGSYTFDCHQVARLIHTTSSATSDYVVVEGRVNNDAHGQHTAGVTQARFEMPYDVMVPKGHEVTNMLVPVAISASHIRFNAVRMEPTWMILGHAAGVAAALSLKSSPPTEVQKIDVLELQNYLLQQQQRIWTSSLLAAAKPVIV